MVETFQLPQIVVFPTFPPTLLATTMALCDQESHLQYHLLISSALLTEWSQTFNLCWINLDIKSAVSMTIVYRVFASYQITFNVCWVKINTESVVPLWFHTMHLHYACYMLAILQRLEQSWPSGSMDPLLSPVWHQVWGWCARAHSNPRLYILSMSHWTSPLTLLVTGRTLLGIPHLTPLSGVICGAYLSIINLVQSSLPLHVCLPHYFQVKSAEPLYSFGSMYVFTGTRCTNRYSTEYTMEGTEINVLLAECWSMIFTEGFYAPQL